MNSVDYTPQTVHANDLLSSRPETKEEQRTQYRDPTKFNKRKV